MSSEQAASRVALMAFLATAVQAQTPTVPVGGEFQVNTYTTSGQYFPSVSVGPGSDFVVVWESAGSGATDTSGDSVHGRRYASDGSALGGDFQVNTYTTGNQRLASASVHPDGGFVVVWDSFGSSGTDTSDLSVQGQRYASDGSALGGEFQVNTYTTGRQGFPSVSVAPNGGFVVVWQSAGSSGTDSSSTSIQGQRYASDGSALGGEFQVNAYTTSLQSAPSVSVGPDGDFVVAWQSYGSSGTDTSSFSVRGQRYASDGSALGGDFQINTYTTSFQSDASVSVSSDGTFVVVWRSSGSSGTDTSSDSVQGQRYASNGSALGGEFQVNTYTTGFQGRPSVSVDPDGDFVVVWESVGSSGTDSSSYSVQGQRYASDGAAIGGEFQVNTYTTDYQFRPSVSVGPAGDFVVAWESSGSSGADTYYSIQSQRFRVTADIGDKVFLDADFDGRQDSSEAGAPGVDVHLRTDLGDLVASTVTDGDGGFLFRPKIALAGVADQFFVEFEAPLFAAFTAPDVGADDTIDSDADPATGETATFEVASAGEVHTDIDAGLIGDAPVIGDRVWHDFDGDGLQGVGESGFAGVPVRLRDDQDAVVASTTTDSQGLFAFTGIASGTYSIEVVVPAGVELVDQDVGVDDEIDSDVDPLTGRSAPFGYTAGTILRSHDAGLRSVPLFADGFESGNVAAWSSTSP